ncbi:MAG: L-seryl-tRNA(Sec) selenium transferase [Terriglobia bacterium]
MPETDASRVQSLLRRIPSVESLLGSKAVRDLEGRLGRQHVTEIVRGVLEKLRERIKLNDGTVFSLESLVDDVVMEATAAAEPSLRAVINATGVVLHTNLGRAPLAREAAARVAEIASQYSNLEYNLEQGERGKRDTHTARLFRDLLGVDETLVVNNNAAAVFLALNTLAEGEEVIVSRGELVEIGGSFRIPEICAKSGAVLREVGSTNRTRVSDYASAITEHTRLLLRVHPSNFRMSGFTERPPLGGLRALAREHNLILMEDLGSGCLSDLAPFGLREEPLVSESLRDGVDLVTFSGDKLLGGPQAGLLLGRSDILQRVRRNPLFRAFRVDKLTLAALEATVALYLRGDFTAIPAQRMIRASIEEIARRALQMAERLQNLPGFSVRLVDGESVAGGGSTPGQYLRTRLIAVTHAARGAEELAAGLRRNLPPVITRVEDDRVLVDLRTVLDEAQEEEILRAFGRLK